MSHKRGRGVVSKNRDDGLCQARDAEGVYAGEAGCLLDGCGGGSNARDCWAEAAGRDGRPAGAMGEGAGGMKDGGVRDSAPGARRRAYLRRRRRSRDAAPASWASAVSPAALAGGHGALPGSAASPPGDGPARPRREAHPRPPQQRLTAVAASSACRPPPRGRRISRPPPLATRTPAARCVCRSDLSVPRGGGVWERAGGAGAEGWVGSNIRAQY